MASLAVAGLLAVAACGGGGGGKQTSGSGGESASGGAAGGAKVEVSAKEFSFTPSDIKAKVGEAVTVVVKNDGSVEHDWSVDGLETKEGKEVKVVVQPGQTGEITFTPSKAGTYDIVCTVPGHKEAGMTGKLTVQ